MLQSNVKNSGGEGFDTPDAAAGFRTPGTMAAWVAYIVLLGGAIALFCAVRAWGSDLEVLHALPLPGPTVSAAGSGTLPRLLLAIAIVALCARVTGYAFQRFLHQPAVVGESAAGILLGPSCLGAVAPDLASILFPANILEHLRMVASIGIVLFMFLVGLELDVSVLRGKARATLAVAHASILVPFSLGALLSLLLYPRYSHHGVPFTVFALFVGTSLSVTAFPVLVRILADRGLQATRLGVTAISCAAVNDATAWCLLALVSSVASARLGEALRTIALTVAFVIVMWRVVQPIGKRLAASVERSKGESLVPFAFTLAGLFLSAAVTEAVGVHALFGAFAFGVCLPHDGRMAAQLRARLHDLVIVLLLPVFFAFMGLRTRLGLVSSTADVAVCVLIIAVASLGKIAGSYVAARYSGQSHADAFALGVLMNTRGLMELIVLNAGLEMGVLSPTLFAMLIVMTLVTTFATSPILTWMHRGQLAAATAS